jgi:serine/threonine protein phosphatase PrpC
VSAPPAALECPTCAELSPAGASWCEACGSELSPEPGAICVGCGEQEIASDGYCMACGRKQPGERDHQFFEIASAVAVSDRGRRHHHNEDAVALGQLEGGGAALVVCDGVSSTPGSADASLAAATAARDLLVDRLTGWQGGESGKVLEALVEAAEVAQAGAASVPQQLASAQDGQRGHGGPPSCTFVAAVAWPVGDNTDVWVAWLGDSRAYWVDDDGATALTEDHEIGGSLIRWLGADSSDHLPDLTSYAAERPGRLLLCSDGLWRYADPPVELAELVRRLDVDHPSTMELAGALVEHALGAGGHDNITVALWPSTIPSKKEKPADE